MGKGSKRHPYAGHTVFLGTLHEKDRAIRPALDLLELRCEPVAIDSDRFGSFCGSIARTGTVLETLRKKVDAVAVLLPEARFVMASEGSFGPHPAFGIIACDHEALLLVDRLQHREFYAETVSLRVKNREIEFGPHDDLDRALAELGAPEHAVLVRPKGASEPIAKGLRKRTEIARTMVECFARSPEARVLISNDLRAHQNPTRMRAIAEAAGNLVEKLSSFCPKCTAPGFWSIRRRTGLRCRACGSKTHKTIGHEWLCGACGHEEFRENGNASLGAEPGDCPECNP